MHEASLPDPQGSGALSTQDPLPEGLRQIGSVERASLVAYLSLIGQRLSEVESQLRTKGPEPKPQSNPWLEFSKILFGGWPAFGFLFMLLFYPALSEAINAIPEKVKSAKEIGVLGVSLKDTIRVEAEKVGALQLSETLPSLTPAAIEFLLRGSREYNSLVSFGLDNTDPRLIDIIWVPGEQTMKILAELEAKKLAAIQIQEDDGTVAGLKQAIENLKRKYSAREGYSSGPDKVPLELPKPVSARPPQYSWRLTDLGKNAVDIILRAVSAQLTPKPGGPEASKK